MWHQGFAVRGELLLYSMGILSESTAFGVVVWGGIFVSARFVLP